MNVIPWYVYVAFSLPLVAVGAVVGVVVAGLRGVGRPLVVTAAVAGALAGGWLSLLKLPRLGNTPWPNLFVGGVVGSCVLSVSAAWLTSRK